MEVIFNIHFKNTKYKSKFIMRKGYKSPPIGCTDKTKLHSSLLFNFILNEPTNKIVHPSNLFLYRKGNYKEINAALNRENWKEIFGNKNVEECLEILNNKYNELIKEHIPKKKYERDKVNTGSNLKWFNAEINQATKEKFKFHAQHRTAAVDRKAELKSKFNNSCREVKRLIKKAHISYEKDLATKSKANPKLLYSYVNSQNTKKEKIRLIITAKGKQLVEGSDIVECLNSQYLDQFTRDDPACSPPMFDSRSTIPCWIDPD